MESNLGRLVTFRTIEDFEIIGMLFQDKEKQNKKVIIHVHGNFGNFFQNKFLWVMSNQYVQNGIDFLSINLSSHDGLAEGYYGRELRYVGGGVADYNSSQFDIAAAIEFVSSMGYSEIILQGHSLGCDKVIQFIINNRSEMPIILLSPVDSYKVQSDWIKPEKIENQIARLKKGKRKTDSGWGKADLDWLNPSEYGARGDTSEWVYQIPVTREALLSILEGAAFRYLNVACGDEFHVSNPTFIFTGKKDGLQMHPTEKWLLFLKSVFSHVTLVSEMEADHDIVGVELELSKRIIEWINGLR